MSVEHPCPHILHYSSYITSYINTYKFIENSAVRVLNFNFECIVAFGRDFQQDLTSLSFSVP